MRAHQHAAPLVVVRSEAESGRVGLRLIGELDLNTVELLEAELSRSREHSPPAIIDLSELRFLDLIGLRALLRAGQGDASSPTRLVGATGIVRRVIELASGLDADGAGATNGGTTTKVGAERRNGRVDQVANETSPNGNGTRAHTSAISSSNGNAS